MVNLPIRKVIYKAEITETLKKKKRYIYTTISSDSHLFFFPSLSSSPPSTSFLKDLTIRNNVDRINSIPKRCNRIEY